MRMLVDRKALLIPFLAALVAIPLSPLVFEGSVSSYFEADHAHQWQQRGGFFLVYRYHPAWPDVGIDAEWQLIPLGILCNVGMYFLIFYTVVLWTRLLLEIRRRRRTALQPAA